MQLGTCLALAMALRVAAALSPHEARALVEKAVEAQGGLEVLARQGAARGKIKGTYVDGGLQFTGEFHSQGPVKLRLALQLKDQGSRLLILNGKKGWLQFDGITQDLDEQTLDRMSKANYVDRVCGLVTLLRDKGYTLALHGESRVEDRPALAVRVRSEGRPDVVLYFDKGSGFLVKAAHRGPEPGANRETLQESYYRDYQRVDTSVRDEKLLKETGRPLDGPSLVKYLREQTPDARAQKQLHELIRQLGDDSFAVRQKASAELVRHGARAAVFLRKACKDADIEVVRRANKCLEQLAADSAAAGAVIRLLAVRRPTGAAEALFAYYPWAADEQVAREVEDALVHIARADKKPHPVLVAALAHTDARVRQLAAAALGKDGGAFARQSGRRLIVEGLRLPRLTILHLDGQKRMELETLEQEFFNRLDDALFERPMQGPEP